MFACQVWSPHTKHFDRKSIQRHEYVGAGVDHSTQKEQHVYKQLATLLPLYCLALSDPCHQNDVSKLEMIQHRSARFVLNKPWHQRPQNDSITNLLYHLQWPTYFKIPKKNCLPDTTF